MAKTRSPNYPGLSLEAAINAIHQVYEKEHRTSVATHSVAQALGHGSLSGPALSKVAALRQYGLLEEISKGKVRVSDEAITILKAPTEAERLEAIRKAALKPSLFSELFSGYEGSSDDALRYYLIKERGFSDEGAGRVIKAFRATTSFAKLSQDSYNARDENRERAGGMSLGETFLHADAPGKSRTADMIARETGARRWSAGGSAGVPLNVYLGPGTIAQISFSHGEPTPDDIDALVEQLQLTKRLLSRGRAQSATEPGRLRDLEAEDDEAGLP